MSGQKMELRYGCNPHQTPAFATMTSGSLPLRSRNGTPGYINLLDALNAWQLVRELRAALDMPAAASFKHVSPAGAAVATPLSKDLEESYFVKNMDLSPLAIAYARARGADRMSSFGDFVAFSDPVDVSAARLLKLEVSDGVIAPGYEPEALEILSGKRGGKYLVLEMDPAYQPGEMERREVMGVTLEQRRNDAPISMDLLLNIVSDNRELPETAKRDLLVATIALKYTQSNSVCFALDGQVIGLGAGQQSRVHCTRLAATKADIWFLRRHPKVLGLRFREGVSRAERNNGVEQYITDEFTDASRKAWEEMFESCPEPFTREEKSNWMSRMDHVALSSDAFFPFRDSLDRAVRSGVRYVVEPGGSVREKDTIAAANEYGMVLIFSGLRLFHH